MKQQVCTTREGLDCSTSVAAQFRRSADGVAEGGLDAFGVQTRQHGIDGGPAAVTRDEDRDLFLRQPALARLAAALARCAWQAATLAFEGFENKRLIRLDNSGQTRGLVLVERRQEAMPPAERGGVVDAAALGRLGDCLASDQRPRLIRPALRIAQP